MNTIAIACANSIIIQGTQVSDRDPKAWLADYFYLPPDYDGSFNVHPASEVFLLILICMLVLMIGYVVYMHDSMRHLCIPAGI